MQSFYSLGQLLRDQLASKSPYLEFLRVPNLSCGIYVLAAGAKDYQQPHRQDEIYYVLTGAGSMKVQSESGEEDRAVGPGDLIFVAAHQEHRFHDVTEELTMLVVFAPAMSG